ncbi:MAG: CDP-alcohol phosphatidyltransferase family protein [Pseudomonadota bacterium]|nr:CDP-alcohol phosphatidyltransferase family protein [Pseudomonadota bacterium]
MLQIVGTCDQRLFGITPAERLRRQRGDLPGPVLVARADTVLSDPAVAWLMENKGTALLGASGGPVAVAVDAQDAEAAASALAVGDPHLKSLDPETVGDMFIRKLRRRDNLFVRNLSEQGSAQVEKQLFDSVYKGITDLVTKYVWPLPAFWVTRICGRLHLHPNAVTIVGMISMVAATILWVQGELVPGLLCAWLMTFLDTVDGKLARVTATSSKIGDLLDHVTDVIHPPIWWAALASMLIHREGAPPPWLIWDACIVILIGYVVGRVLESGFKARFGYNPYLWRPFDSAFRTVVSRRNIILLIMTVGVILGMPEEAFVGAAVWTLLSVLIQAVRFGQAIVACRGGPLPSWLT